MCADDDMMHYWLIHWYMTTVWCLVAGGGLFGAGQIGGARELKIAYRDIRIDRRAEYVI